MNITDWDAWMKNNHVKIYAEEELRNQKLKKAVRHAASFLKTHKEEILRCISHRHASET